MMGHVDGAHVPRRVANADLDRDDGDHRENGEHQEHGREREVDDQPRVANQQTRHGPQDAHFLERGIRRTPLSLRKLLQDEQVRGAGTRRGREVRRPCRGAVGP